MPNENLLEAGMPIGYRKDDTGVLVPLDIARKRVRFSHTDTKKIDAATRASNKNGLDLQLCCKQCGPRVRLQLMRDHDTGFKKLVCHCSERILTGGV